MRIICLTEETTEFLYEIGANDNIVGISKYTKRPFIARKEKPKISHFIDADIEKIKKLKPDLVLAWSDLQANICAELIRSGIEVYCFNHRSIAGIFNMMEKLGNLIGFQYQTEKYLTDLRLNLDYYRKLTIESDKRPSVYFEEWFDPIITGIEWVVEIVELCGGIDAFPKYSKKSLAKDRIIANHNEIVIANPDIMLVSWCGKPFRRKKLDSRKDWNKIKFYQNNQIFEIDSTIILQPGPAALTDGVKIIYEIINNWRNKKLFQPN